MIPILQEGECRQASVRAGGYALTFYMLNLIMYSSC